MTSLGYSILTQVVESTSREAISHFSETPRIKSLCHGLGDWCSLPLEQSIFITARDANGCVLPDHSVQFEVDFVGPSTPVAAVTAAPDLGPGVYRATYVPVAQGSYQVKVTSAGEAAGSVQCTSHCEGHSLRVDGYGGVQIDEGSAHSPLDLAGAAFTAAAWVRREVSSYT